MSVTFRCVPLQLGCNSIAVCHIQVHSNTTILRIFIPYIYRLSLGIAGNGANMERFWASVVMGILDLPVYT